MTDHVEAPAVDPVRAGVIAALARRAAAQQGAVRALLLQRIEVLRAAAADACSTPPAPAAAPAPRHGLAGLSALVDRLGRTPDSATPVPAAAPVSLKTVTAFKGTWSRLRAEQRLRQALDQVPAMAGPLHSSNVVNRALQTLRDLSPDYLDACMAHVDTLVWLERASGGGGPAHRAAPAAEVRKRPGTRTPRKG